MSKTEQNGFIDEKNNVLRMFNKLTDIGKQIGIELQQNKFKCLMDTPYENYKSVAGSDLEPIKQNTTIFAESVRGFVKGIFKHYDVNPSIEGYNQKILSTYVFENIDVVPQLKGLHRANKDGVNPGLYNKILETIENIKSGEDIQSEEKTIYITGVRGSGKTAFFNYFISRYESELNSNNIITVRINVMRTLQDVDIKDAIKFKLCRILFTYYCSWDTDVERLKDRTRKDKIDCILNNFIENKYFEQATLDLCHAFFCKYNSRELISIPSEYSEICEKLLEEMSKEYKYIIMLDNLDQLSPNERNKNEYKKRKEQLESIKSTLIFNHSVLLIAVRYSTFRGLQFIGRKKPTCWVVGVPKTFYIVKKRMNYFIDNNQSNDEEKEQRREYLVNCMKFIGRNFTQKDEDLSLEEACNNIDLIYAENKRAILNIMRRFIEANFQTDINYGVLDSYLTRNNYKFFETLPIDTDTGYCKLYFKYLLKDGSTLSFGNIHSSAHHDHNYMPNIYRFPSVSGNRDMMFSPFLKIRILQLLRNYNEDLNTGDVITILDNIFSYRKDAIKLACIELREDQSIIFRNEKLEESKDNDIFINNISIGITNRGKKFLEILPNNVNLLAVCLEHIYFPKECLRTGMPVGNYNEESSNYIIRNIFCSLPKAIGLLNSTEQFEQKLYGERLLKLSNSKYNYSKCFNVQNDFLYTEQLEKSARRSADMIFNTHFINPAGSESPGEAVYRARRTELFNQLSKATPI